MLKPILTLFFTLTIISVFSQFLPPQAYSEGTLGYYGPNSVLGDVNGDGNDDLVSTSDSFVKVLPGTSSSFGQEVILPFTAFPEFDATGYFNLRDMDGDDDLDIVNGFGWIENDAFTFNETHAYGSAHLGSLLTLGTFTGDLNGDGAEDVILPSVLTAGPYLYKAIVMFNDGAGNFPDNTMEILFNAQLNDGWVADADNDGDLDFLSTYNAQVYLFINDGQGQFTQQPAYSGMNSRIIFTDLNADGLADIFYPNGFNFTVRLNQGNYDFSVVQNIPVVEYTSWWSYGFRDDVQDYEGDGDLDIVYQTQGGKVYLLTNDGNGQLSMCCIVSNAYGATQGVDLWKDLNNDGRADCIRCNRYVSCSLQQENGEQTAFDIIGGGLEGYDTGVQLLDLDEDGDQDIVTPFSNGMGMYRNDGTGNVSDIEFVAAHQAIQPLGLEDMNGDGIQDLVGLSSDIISYFEGLGNGSFGSPQTMLTLSFGRTAALADVNLDGKKDLVVVKLNSPFELSWYEYDDQNGISAPVVLGTFTNDGNSTSNGQQHVFESGDYNGDGNIDFSVTAGASLRIFHGNGSGGYTMVTPSRPVVSGELIFHVSGTSADFSGDGRDDILYASVNINNGSGYLGLIKYNGTTYTHQLISIQSGQQYELDSYFGHLDFDADGDEDVVYTTGHSVLVLSNDGSGIMQNLFSTTMGMSNPNFGQMALGDLDQDGLADIVFGETASNQPADMKYYTAFNNLDSPYQVHCHVFIDDNGNGLQDNGEVGFNNRQLYFGSTWGYGYSNLNGDFTLFALPGEITASLDENTALWNATTPWNYTIALSEESQSADLYFGLQPNGYQPHVTSDLVLNEGICSGDATHWVSVTNTGNTIISGYFVLNLDPLMYFVTADELPLDLGNNAFSWLYDSLYYGESITIQFDAVNPDYTFIGTSVYNSLVTKITDENDEVIFTDTDTENFVVNCAYDPNMKEEENGWSDEGYILPDGRLHYTIHFQNTGTAAASYVRIEDELSADLDWSSMQLLSSSHEFSAWIEADGTANFEFENIVLPDSSADYLGSMGFISFLISPNEGLIPGTIIPNNAAIYFDLNPPVITETISNTIFDCVNLAFDVPAILCESGSTAVVSGRNDFETYSWYVDDVFAGTGAVSEISIETSGEHVLRLEAVNPICALSHEVSVNVEAMPIFESVAIDQTFCGDELLLEAYGDGTIEWSRDGQLVGSGNSIEIASAGDYMASISNACGTVSELISVAQGDEPLFENFTSTALLCQETVALEAYGIGSVEWIFDGQSIGAGPTLDASQAGAYEVVISTACGSATEVINVAQGTLPGFEFVSEDMLLCDEAIVLEAIGNGDVEWSRDGQTVGSGSTIEIMTAGVYEAAISNVCGVVSEVISVTQGAMPEFLYFTGGFPLCAETTLLDAYGNGSIEWLVDGQVVGVGLTFEISTAGIYEVALSNECGVTSQLITITQGAAPQFEFISGNTVICEEVLTLEAIGNGEITWMFEGIEIAAGNSLVAESPGVYTAVLQNSCGLAEHAFDVQLGDLPLFTSTVGEQKITCEETAAIYAYADLPVEWYFGNEMVGAGSMLLVEETGIYQAVISNGCLENAVDFNVQLLPTPSLEVTLSGPTEFCAGDSLTVEIDTNAPNTFWMTSEGGLLDVFDYTAFEDDFIQISVSDGICDTVAYINVTVYDNPSVDLEVSEDGAFILATNGFMNYAWTVDGVSQSDIAGNSIPVNLGVNYSITVTDENGCSASNTIQYDAVLEMKSGQLEVYPNPTSGVVTLSNSTISPDSPILVYNSQGQLVQSEFGFVKHNKTVDLSALASGVYSLRVGNKSCLVIVQK